MRIRKQDLRLYIGRVTGLASFVILYVDKILRLTELRTQLKKHAFKKCGLDAKMHHNIRKTSGLDTPAERTHLHSTGRSEAIIVLC